MSDLRGELIWQHSGGKETLCGVEASKESKSSV